MEKKKESLKEIMDGQYVLRCNLTEILVKKQISLNKLADDIGVNRGTITKFLTLGKDIEVFLTLMKIKNYIEKNS